jgi:hypothetical protein
MIPAWHMAMPCAIQALITKIVFSMSVVFAEKEPTSELSSAWLSAADVAEPAIDLRVASWVITVGRDGITDIATPVLVTAQGPSH